MRKMEIQIPSEFMNKTFSTFPFVPSLTLLLYGLLFPHTHRHTSIYVYIYNIYFFSHPPCLPLSMCASSGAVSLRLGGLSSCPAASDVHQSHMPAHTHKHALRCEVARGRSSLECVLACV